MGIVHCPRFTRQAMSIAHSPLDKRAFGYSLMQCIRVHFTKFCLQARSHAALGLTHQPAYNGPLGAQKFHCIFSDKYGCKFKAGLIGEMAQFIPLLNLLVFSPYDLKLVKIFVFDDDALLLSLTLTLTPRSRFCRVLLCSVVFCVLL